MAEQTNLNIEIGTTETQTLRPTQVKIVAVKIVNVEKAKAEKLVLSCKHPDKEDSVDISEIKSETKGQLKVTGLWIKKDKEGKLIKNSAIATLLNTFGCKTPQQLVSKDVPTILDDKGYLAVKCY